MRNSADVGAHDARVPGEASEHDEAERGHHVAQQRDAVARTAKIGGGERGDGEGDGEIAAVEHHHERQRDGRRRRRRRRRRWRAGWRECCDGSARLREAVGGEIEEGGRARTAKSANGIERSNCVTRR